MSAHRHFDAGVIVELSAVKPSRTFKIGRKRAIDETTVFRAFPQLSKVGW